MEEMYTAAPPLVSIVRPERDNRQLYNELSWNYEYRAQMRDISLSGTQIYEWVKKLRERIEGVESESHKKRQTPM